jgi:DNA-binding IclR family transcriptional regulator
MATGKLLLAFLPEDRRDALIEQLDLERRTPHTITSRTALRAELAAVRKRGHARSIEEGSVGVAALAVPVRDSEGRVIASIAINAPAVRLDARRQKAVLPELLSTAAEIEALWAGREEGTSKAGPGAGGT